MVYARSIYVMTLFIYAAIVIIYFALPNFNSFFFHVQYNNIYVLHPSVYVKWIIRIAMEWLMMNEITNYRRNMVYNVRGGIFCTWRSFDEEWVWPKEMYIVQCDVYTRVEKNFFGRCIIIDYNRSFRKHCVCRA